VCFSIGAQSKPEFKQIELPPQIARIIDQNTGEVILLYGIVCVGGCPIGNHIYTVKDRKDVIFIVPPHYSDYEIANLKRGDVRKGENYQGLREEY